MKGALKAAAATIWVYSYATLGAMMALAALPGFFLARWGWSLQTTAVGPAWVGLTLDPLAGLYFSILGFFVFGIALMFVLPLMKFIFRWKPHVGEVPVHSFKIWPWYNYNGMLFMFNTVYGRFARLTTLYPVFLRMMGARIGRDAVVNTHHIYDLDIIEIGERTIIGANASILGHVGERGRLVRQPIHIGKHCTVGQYANIFPGVTMGDNCHVGAMSLVPKGTTLDANAVYGGVPVRKIRDLKPGERATSDDVSGTAGVPADGLA
ncbi:MAG TPA: DapH/DapD/GlmU-related protein [Candidatus Thermoplasmatota archaeon]|nr:DapH/DapD/GlmU-related protein [Candidatus Thermoplasmatota archaeon]